MEDIVPTSLAVPQGEKSPLEIPSTPETVCDKADTSSERGTPDSRCVICLGKLQNKSFTDSCLHEFCFKCLLQWSKVKAECPLCKQAFKSIIHNVRSILDYDLYEVPGHDEPDSPLLSIRNVRSINASINASNILYNLSLDNFGSLVSREARFRYRSTMTTDYLRGIAQTFLVTARLQDERQQLPSAGHDYPLTSDTEHPRRRRYRIWRSMRLRRTNFRRAVYDNGLWVEPLTDVSGRYRECTPAFFRENPAATHRLWPWLDRELNVLLRTSQSPAVDSVLTLVMEALPIHPIKSRAFRNKLQPFLREKSDHFVHEFYHFTRSPYDMAGFDEHAVYKPHASNTLVVSSSSSSDESEVEIVREIPKICLPRPRSSLYTMYDNEPVAGPSGLSRHAPNRVIYSSTSTSRDTSPGAHEVLQIPSSSSNTVHQSSSSRINNSPINVDSDSEIEIIPVAKPTPIVVNITSDDDDIKDVTMEEEKTSNLTSDEDYHPREHRRKKKTKRKSKSKKRVRVMSSDSCENDSDSKPLSYLKKNKNKRKRSPPPTDDTSSESELSKRRLKSYVVVPNRSRLLGYVLQDFPSTSRSAPTSSKYNGNTSSASGQSRYSASTVYTPVDSSE